MYIIALSDNVTFQLYLRYDYYYLLASYLLTYLLLTYLLSYLLTQWNRVVPKKLTGSQIVKNFPGFYGKQSPLAHLHVHAIRPCSYSFLSSPCPQTTSRKSILILSSYLRLVLPSNLFPLGFLTKTMYTPPLSLVHITCPALTTRFFDVAKFTILTPLSLLT